MKNFKIGRGQNEKYIGPYTVVDKIGKVDFLLKSKFSKKCLRRHYNDLKKKKMFTEEDIGNKTNSKQIHLDTNLQRPKRIIQKPQRFINLN